MDASRDENSVPTLLGASEADGTTLIRIEADPTTHYLMVENGSTGTDFGPQNSPRDQNSVPALMAVSSADGVTPVVVYANASGELLIDSN